MGGLPEKATMVGGNVYHKGENFGDEDDMLIVNLEYSDDRYAVLEYGNAFRWGEHYVLIQGTEGAIKLDLFNTGGTLRVKGEGESHFLVHETQEEDDDRTSYLYRSWYGWSNLRTVNQEYVAHYGCKHVLIKKWNIYMTSLKVEKLQKNMKNFSMV